MPRKRRNKTDAELEAESIFTAHKPAPNIPDLTVSVPEITNLGRNFHDVVETTFELDDAIGEYEAIREWLSIKNTLTPEAITESANHAEDMALRAQNLAVVAKLEVESYKAEIAVAIGSMKTGAIAELQEEKKNGERTKQITEGDVVDYAATLYPDEWRAAHANLAKAKGTLNSIERLADLASKRCYTLAAMLQPKRLS